MAKAKKSKAKAKPTAKAKPKPKAKAKPTAKTKAKPKAKAKPTTKAKPTAKPKAKATPAKPAVDTAVVEQRVAEMLADYDSGAIDNAFDVIGDAYELDQQLPKTSKLRPAFNTMYQELGEICQSVGG